MQFTSFRDCHFNSDLDDGQLKIVLLMPSLGFVGAFSFTIDINGPTIGHVSSAGE